MQGMTPSHLESTPLPCARPQMEKAAANEALGGVQAALSAAQADGGAALAEVAALTTQLDAAERSKAALEADLGSHIERHASGVQDFDALSRQLAAAQAQAAAASSNAAELQVEVGPSRYGRVLFSPFLNYPHRLRRWVCGYMVQGW